MPLRKVIHIDEDKCDGCGECVTACAEGAIAVIDGKARLISDTYCDGLGACLGECPQDAISMLEREAEAYDEKAIVAHLRREKPPVDIPIHPAPSGCPGSAIRQFQKQPVQACPTPSRPTQAGSSGQSRLGHWPVQLMLVPPHAPFLRGAHLLICADCVPFAVPDFHERYLNGKAVVVGCPKLDDLQHYFEKLQAIFETARPEKVTVLRMEVPCCGGIAQAAMKAAELTCPEMPVEVHTIGVGGDISVEPSAVGRAV